MVAEDSSLTSGVNVIMQSIGTLPIVSNTYLPLWQQGP